MPQVLHMLWECLSSTASFHRNSVGPRVRVFLPLFAGGATIALMVALASVISGALAIVTAAIVLTAILLFGATWVLLLRIEDRLDAQAQDMESLVAAQISLIPAMVTAEAPLPHLGSWSVDLDLLLDIVLEVTSRDGLCIVELGGGGSTVHLAHWVNTVAQETRFICVEHEEAHLRRVSSELHRYGVGAELVHAPLADIEDKGGLCIKYPPQVWYSLDALKVIDAPVDILVVDGPPGGIEKGIRSGAELLFPLMPAGSIVFVDDVVRPDERDAISAWVDCGLVELVFRSHRYVKLRRI